jgi:hypothetical protein
VSGSSRSRQVIDSITQAARQAEEQQANPISPTLAPGKKDRNWEDDHPAPQVGRKARRSCLVVVHPGCEILLSETKQQQQKGELYVRLPSHAWDGNNGRVKY